METSVRMTVARDSAAAFYRLGDLLVDIGRARVTREGTELPLPKLSFDLLLALIREAPNLMSVDELMRQVWPGLVVGPETVSQRVKLLRDALADDPKNPRYISAIRGRGYRVVADVQKLDADPTAPRASGDEPVRNRSRFLISALIVSALLIATTAAVFLWRSNSREVRSSVVVAAAPTRSVAVLPFENLSTEPNSAVLTMGITESVLHQLATHEQLMVIARTSSFAFAGRNVDVREIGRTLNARYLLEGSVQGGQNRLRVIAQLVDSESGVRVWSMRFDRTLEDVFALQDEIATAVARALEASVTVSAVAKTSNQETDNLDAWLAYQQARALIATRKKYDLEQAVVRLQEAIRQDATFAAAYTALAEARLLLTLFSTSDSWLSAWPSFESEQEEDEIRQLLARAIEINPQDGRPYLLRAWIQDSPEHSEADYRHGLMLNPNDAAGFERFAKMLYFFPGPNGEDSDPKKRVEAFEMIDRARELDPLTPSVHITKALMTLYGHGNVSEANALLLQALAAQPNYYPALMRLAELRWCCQGELAEAVKYGEQALTVEPQAAWPRHFLVHMYLDLRDQRAAQSVAAQSTTPDPVLQMIVHYSRREWKEAGLLAYSDWQTVLGIDWPIRSASVLQHARITGETERARRTLQEWSGVTWSSRGEPRVDDTVVQYGAHIALAQVLQLKGDEVKAKRLLERVLQSMDYQMKALRRGTEASAERARVLALLGRNDEALRVLRLAFDATDISTVRYTTTDEPAFEQLRSDPRFQAVSRMVQARVTAQRSKLDGMREAGLAPRRDESTKLVRQSD